MNNLEIIEGLCIICRDLAGIVKELAVSAAHEDNVRLAETYQATAEKYKNLTGEELTP